MCVISVTAMVHVSLLYFVTPVCYAYKHVSLLYDTDM